MNWNKNDGRMRNICDFILVTDFSIRSCITCDIGYNARNLEFNYDL